MDTQTGFWGQTTGARKHRYIGKHTYGIKIRDLVRKTAFGINFAVIGIENQNNIVRHFQYGQCLTMLENTKSSLSVSAEDFAEKERMVSI